MTTTKPTHEAEEHVEPRTAFEAAVKLIEPYVLRGDDPHDIKRGYMGAYCGKWGAQVGGRLYHGADGSNKHFTGDKILVQRVNGTDCAEVFSFDEVYRFIKRRSEQPTLFAI